MHFVTPNRLAPRSVSRSLHYAELSAPTKDNRHRLRTRREYRRRPEVLCVLYQTLRAATSPKNARLDIPRSGSRSRRHAQLAGLGALSYGVAASKPAWEAGDRTLNLRTHGRQRRAPRIQGETVTSPATGATDAPDLPEYAPVPAIAKGAPLNEHGYHVWQVERNLYAVTDNVYMSAFLTTPDGVVIFDAPPNIGHNIRRAVDEITATNGLTNQVTHMVYSHHHCDHQGASSLFGGDIVRIGHEETRRLLLRDDDPARPVPDVTFSDSYTLEVGGERVELAWHGPNHSPDNIYIHFPGHDTLMFIDVVNAGWIPIYNLNLSDDVIGYSGAPAIALDYPWTHLISGHLGRVATREDVAMHQQYIADIEASSREALASVNPGPIFKHYGENVWAAVEAYRLHDRERGGPGEDVDVGTAQHSGVFRDDGGGRVLGDGVEVGSDRCPYVLAVVLENRSRVDRGQRLA